MLRSSLLSAALLLATNVAAQVTISDTPGEAPQGPVAPSPCCGAAIIPAGHFEVETNYAGDTAGSTFTHTSNLTLKYSFTDHLQVQLATGNLLVAGGDGSRHSFDGLSPAVKYVFLDEGDLVPQMAVTGAFVFPTYATADALQRTLDVSATAHVSKTFGALHFDATLSLTLADLVTARVAQGGASLAATWNINSNWGLATGPYSSFGNAQKLPVDGGWWVGLNYAPIPQIALTAGVEAGFFPESRAFSVFAGVAFVPTALIGTPLVQAPVKAPEQMLAMR